MPGWNDVLALDGFSSPQNRRILNRAVSSVLRPRVLEVGSHKGSTAVAMCYENAVESIHLVDNFSEFGDTRQELLAVCERFALPAFVHDVDWFGPLPEDVFGGQRFNVYFYDGPHGEEHHARELAVALPHLDDRFLYIVDDYSWQHVRRGHDAGLLSLGSRVSVIVANAYQSETLNDASGYWNGLFVAWCRKK